MPQGEMAQEKFDFLFALKSLAADGKWDDLAAHMKSSPSIPFHELSRQALSDILKGCQADLAEAFFRKDFHFADGDTARLSFVTDFIRDFIWGENPAHVLYPEGKKTEAFRQTLTIFLDNCVKNPAERTDVFVKVASTVSYMARDFLLFCARGGISIGDTYMFVSSCIEKKHYALILDAFAARMSPAPESIHRKLWPLIADTTPLKDESRDVVIHDFSVQWRRAVAKDPTLAKALTRFDEMKKETGDLSSAAFVNTMTVDDFGAPVSLLDALAVSGRAQELFNWPLAPRWKNAAAEVCILAENLQARPGIGTIGLHLVEREIRVARRKPLPARLRLKPQ